MADYCFNFLLVLDGGGLAGHLGDDLLHLLTHLLGNLCTGLNILVNICLHRNRLAHFLLNLGTGMHVARLGLGRSLAVVSTISIAMGTHFDFFAISLLKPSDLLPNLDSLCGAGLLGDQLAGAHLDGLVLLHTWWRVVVAMVAIPWLWHAQGGGKSSKQNNNLKQFS